MGLLTARVDPFFAPFAGGAAVLVVAAVKRMLALGLTPEAVLERYEAMVRASRADMTPADRPSHPARSARLARCPQCGGRLHGMRINRSRCTRVDGGYTRLHWCDHCDFEEYL